MILRAQILNRSRYNIIRQFLRRLYGSLFYSLTVISHSNKEGQGWAQGENVAQLFVQIIFKKVFRAIMKELSSKRQISAV